MSSVLPRGTGCDALAGLASIAGESLPAVVVCWRTVYQLELVPSRRRAVRTTYAVYTLLRMPGESAEATVVREPRDGLDGARDAAVAEWHEETTAMDGPKFDAVARRLASGLTRRGAVRGLVAGAVGAVASRTGLREAEAGRRRCLRAGEQCDRNGQCCPKQTGRICKQPNPPSGSEVCCSPKGEPCGGENQNGPVKPQCCFPLRCSSRNGGKCR